jgi:quercetin dioxygenase-like cupin family protein
MHRVGKVDEVTLAPSAKYERHSVGYRQAPLIDHSTGSVHTELTVNELDPSGTLSPHVHSYEKGFYILSGQAVVGIGEQAYLLGPGDYGAIKVGTPHAWRAGSQPVRWLQMAAPQPKPDGELRDTYFLKNGQIPLDAKPMDLTDLKGNLLGHFDASQVPAVEARKDVMPGLEGVFLNWLIDHKFGASHHRLAFIEYQPGVGIGFHDHTFEESYFILSGEIEAILDGERYVAKAGDFAWTGVGCVHSFVNKSQQPVRWLETFSPQPPAENAFRFKAEWDKRAKEIEG